MVYVDKNGKVTERQPWGMKKLYDLFWTTIDGVLLFFQTLIPGYAADRRIGFRSSSGGSAGGRINYSGGSGGRGPSPRPFTNARFRTMADIRPTPYAGGCSGGSCGL